MVHKLLADGHDVIGWNRSPETLTAFQAEIAGEIFAKKLVASASHEDLIEQLTAPRVIWLMLPAGSATQDTLDEIVKHMQAGDIIIDGGNAHFSDTERRSKELRAKGIGFLGIGVSGGIHALTNGYPLMVGGEKSAYETVTPILDSLAKPHGGHQYFGTGGAGHFVKMVHNGIEYGMMQALGEGFGVLEKSPYSLDLLSVAELYQKNSIVSGFLMDRAKDGLEKDATLSENAGPVSASGEGAWTVEEAKKTGVPIGNIEQALDFRKRSQTDTSVQDSFAAKMLNTLRREFGGHEVKKKD